MSNEVTIFGSYNAQGIPYYFIQISSHFKSTFFQNLAAAATPHLTNLYEKRTPEEN